MWRKPLPWAVPAGALLAGCAAVFGFEDLTDAVGDAGSSSSSSGASGSAPDAGEPDAASSCPTIPPNTVPDRQGGPVVFALDAVQLLDDPARENGYDLDGLRTVDDETSSCVRTTPTATPTNDSVCGTDTVSQVVFGNVGLLSDAVRVDNYGERLAYAEHGALLTVADVESTFTDDGSVVAYWLPVRHLQRGSAASDGGCAPRDFVDAGDGGPATQSYADLWCHDDQFVRPDSKLSVLAGAGYVRDHVLVVRFPEIYLPLTQPKNPAWASYLRFRDVRITATVEREDGGTHYRLVHGVISGRWKTSDVFYQLAALSAGTSKLDGGCRLRDEEVSLLVPSLCAVRDLALDGGTDVGCDSVSVGIGFGGYQVESIGRPHPDFRSWEYRCDARLTSDGQRSDAGGSGPPVPIDDSDCPPVIP